MPNYSTTNLQNMKKRSLHYILNIIEGINRGQPRNNLPNTFNIPPHNYPMSMSTNGLPPPGGMPQNQQPYHPQSQKMPMQQPWSGGSAGSSGTY